MLRQILRFSASSLLTILIVGLIRTSPTRAMQIASSPQQARAEDAEGEIESHYKQGTESYEKAFGEFETKASLDQPFHYDLSFLADYLQTQVRTGPTPAARQLAAVYLSALKDYDVLLPEDTYVQVARLVS